MSNKFKILFISIIMFGLFGCTQLPPSNNLGSIRVDISGLPTDIAADIMLSGPGYNKKITSSSTIDGLKPNKYIVSARSFSTNSLKYEAAITETSVDVAAGKTAMVKVKYSSNKLYQVSVLVTGPGRVKSADNKINCTSSGARCSYFYNEGTEVLLTAEANNAAKFVSWNEDKENVSASFKVIADSNQTVKAQFAKIAKPDISDPSPSSIKVVSKLNETSLTSFSFENKGIDSLIYSIEENVDWLEPKTLNGKLPAGKKQSINLEVTCSNTAEIYTTVVNIKSNDPDEELKTVAVSLECKKEPANYELKIALSGLGKVTSADGNIDCQADKTEKCSYSYQENTIVKLTASPNTKYKFESWAGSSKETTEELNITMNSSKDLTAKFIEYFGPPVISEPSPKTIKISAEVNKSGQESFSFSNIGGEELSYTITGNFDWLAVSPAEGSLKAGKKQIFTVVGSCPSNAAIYNDNLKITSNDPKTPTKFVNVNLNCTNIPESKNRLTINVIGPGSIKSTDGHIDCNSSGGNCSYNYIVDSNIELTAVADKDANFSAWSQDASGSETPIIVKMDAAKSISAKFVSANIRVLTVSVNGSGTIKSADGNINCSASSNQCSYEYLLGNSISLTANPDLNFEFDSWSGDSSATTDTINIDIDDNKTLEAKFIASSKRLLNITVNGPGTVTSSDGNIDCSASSNLCSYSYELNTAVSLTATADTDSSFQSWSGACSGSGACELSISDNLELSADFSANTGSQYGIDFVLLGSAKDTARKAVFETAASNWSKVIVGQLSSEAVDLQANQACGYGEGAIKQTVNGLLIVAAIVPIDGVGGILGQAGPRFIRDGSGLPVIGCMQFDEADIANMETNNSFGGVIMHEMGHVIGIGTLWSHKNLMNDYQPSDACSSSSASFTTKPSFIGAKAIAEYASLGGTGNIPVEDEFGVGTRCGHWDEATFKTELMTGFASSGQMPLSRMTAASLQDMGYGIDISAADSYSLPSIYSASIDQFELNEELIYPEFKINSFGRIVKLK